MWRTFAVLLLATSLFAGTAVAGMGGAGGGGGMGVTGTNYGQSTLGNNVQPAHPAKRIRHPRNHHVRKP